MFAYRPNSALLFLRTVEAPFSTEDAIELMIYIEMHMLPFQNDFL